MKIIHFAHSYLPVYGGTTIRLLNLLEESDIDYLFYTASDLEPTELKKRERFKNVLVKRVPIQNDPVPKPIKGLDFYYYQKAVERKSDKLYNAVSENDFQIVHAHNPIYFSLAAAKLAKKTGKPLIYEIHSFFDIKELISDKDRKRKFGTLRAWLKYWLLQEKEKQIARMADKVIVQTSDLAEKVIKTYNLDQDKVKLLPNGVSTSVFDPKKWQEEAKSFRKKMGWENKTVFMYSGFLKYTNGVDVLVKSFIKLPKETKKKVKLVIFGRGELEGFLKKIAQKNKGLIDFLDQVPYPKMPLYYATCDVFVIPRPAITANEAVVPLKLIEAAAMEKLILVSSVGGLKKIVKDGKSGLVFRKNNPKDLINKIKLIAGNYQKYSRLGIKARELVKSEYDWQKSRSQLKKIYKEVIKNA